MTVRARRSVQSILLTLVLLGLMQVARAQGVPAPGAAPGMLQPGTPVGVIDWLERMHDASRRNSYIGTFVVSAASGDLSSARIWHARDASSDSQMERVEALTGPPRSTFRRGDEVMTFLPDRRVVRSEKRSDFGEFPRLGKPDESIGRYYDARFAGQGRVAGFETDVIELVPRDPFRFGYRIWVEKRSGLLTKLQTLDGNGRAVEQSAFSELELDAPVQVQALQQMMRSTDGYRLEKVKVERTTPEAEGWALRQQVPGFRPMHCFRRDMRGGPESARTMQWIFSDGLASVSLFVEPYDAQRQPREGLLVLGATYTLTRRLSDAGQEWWLTAVGEVPAQTLERFASSLERLPR